MAKVDKKTALPEVEDSPLMADAAPVEQPPAPPASVAVSMDVPVCTVRTFARGRFHDPIVQAFVSCEERVHATRKLPESQWLQLLHAFKSAAR